MLKNQPISCPECGTVYIAKGSISTLLVCNNCNAVSFNETGQKLNKQPIANDWSIIQIGTRGTYQGESFEVIGRIHLQLRRDYKDFWCIWIESDRCYRWIVESMGSYAFCVDNIIDVDIPIDLSVGAPIELANSEVVNIDIIDSCDEVRYSGETKGWKEFSSDFEVAQGSNENTFALFIFSKSKSISYVTGNWIQLKNLDLKTIKDWNDPDEEKNQIILPCPQCKQENKIRGKSLTIALTCEACGEYFTTKKWSKDILKFNESHVPALPIGAIGKFNDVEYEVMGFSVKYVRKYRYSWREYVMYNPHYGLAYLSEYNGHWNFLLPSNHTLKKAWQKIDFSHNDANYRLYQKFQGLLVFAKGEFFSDAYSISQGTYSEEYISPPYLISFDHDGVSHRWFTGEYKSKQDIENAFSTAKLNLPLRIGRGYTQPVFESFAPESLIKLCLAALLAIICLQVFFSNAAKEKLILESTFRQSDINGNEKVFVTPSFFLEGKSKSLTVNITAPISNDWFYGDFTLVDEGDQTEYNFSKEVEYYYGTEGGETWSEGTKQEEAFLSKVPEGNYHINIYPEFSNTNNQFSITVVRDVPNVSNMWITLIIISLFPVFYFIRRHHIESKRWSDSDYSPYSE